ncbi:DUF427 domain-containing protein [Asticcacaulis solisilvae]|uniref:DUF427 domain-containing protein n=1 Tax=Asticcacaulis solisilvae TaxID=1217274 RepID=UPI003FD786FF
MTDKPIKIPGPDHPITITPEPARVVVRAGGQVVADTTRALSLKEASYPAVLYIPREDADMALYARSSLTTYCPYKGECSYYSLPAGGGRSRDAVWSYEHPYESVASIKDHLAFYPDRVDEITRSPA